MKVLHVIREVTRGGASLGLLNMCRRGPAGAVHGVLPVLPSEDGALAPFGSGGIRLFRAGDVDGAFAWADLVQIEWWNTKELVRFLLGALPPCRLVLHSRAHFDAPYMCPSLLLLERVDMVSVSTPSAARNPVFEALRRRAGLPPPRCVYSAAAADAAPPAVRRGTQRAIGYLGTVEDVKMHDRTLPMVAAILRAVPDLRAVFVGEGHIGRYQREAEGLGIAGRTAFLGFTEKPFDVIAPLELLFYPLNPYTYATSEKAVQEAMLCRLPVAAFPHGGLRDLLTGDCAVLGRTEDELVGATVKALRDPAGLDSLGENARRRVEEWPIARDWRREAQRGWEDVLRRPRRPRPAAAVAGDLLAAAHAPAACPVPEDATLARQRSLVARFVLETYR